MAEATDKESRTEAASEKRLREAIEKGNVPVSREVGLFAGLAGIALALAFAVPLAASTLATDLALVIERSGAWRIETGADSGAVLGAVGEAMARAVAPTLGLCIVLGLSAGMMQNPPRLVFDRLVPKASRLSPMEGWTRLFGAAGRIEFGKTLAKVVVFGLVTALALSRVREDVLRSALSEGTSLPSRALLAVAGIVAWLLAVTGALAAFDLVWVRLRWARDLRMSRQELKQETRENDGDPQVKRRMRQLGLARARRRMMAAVPRATLVIANPTHYAIALRYVRGENAAPLVLAKGHDALALRIREAALAHRVPVIENPPLARALFDQVEVDRLIPAPFYKAVAEIIHRLARIDARASPGLHAGSGSDASPGQGAAARLAP